MEACERRDEIVRILASSSEPVTGASLASALGVTRQVIVQDVAVIRARGEAIIATPRGYTRWAGAKPAGVIKLIAVRHNFAQTQEELLVMVNAGVEVIDVIVEHPVYGQLTGQLSISTPEDVLKFMDTIERTQAGLLSSLTDGTHLHTVKASNSRQIENLEQVLLNKGFLLAD
jgi:transcriptional regulator of NAD metabolism